MRFAGGSNSGELGERGGRGEVSRAEDSREMGLGLPRVREEGGVIGMAFPRPDARKGGRRHAVPRIGVEREVMGRTEEVRFRADGRRSSHQRGPG